MNSDAIIENLITGKVILAEKRQYISRVIKDQLEAQGYRVFVASGEEEIFEILRNENPEISLVDFGLIDFTDSDLCPILSRRQTSTAMA